MKRTVFQVVINVFESLQYILKRRGFSKVKLLATTNIDIKYAQMCNKVGKSKQMVLDKAGVLWREQSV